MRKSFITKEYSLEKIAGSMNMKEQKNFFSSKILEIEDTLYIGNNNITWTESSDKTQGIRLEDINNTFNTESVKYNNHSIKISSQQSEQERKIYTKWELTFNIRKMITQYIYANLKANRVFSNIDNKNTINNDIDDAINQYIIYNVYPRIGFFNIVLYVQYYKIGEEEGVLDSENNPIIALQYDTQFRENLILPPSIGGETTEEYNSRVINYKNNITVKKFDITTDTQQDVATLIYKQTLSSQDYKFDYYYDVIWKKL
jgi:hypothetical protein